MGILVDVFDGKCRACGGQLEIVAADDATMDVVCTNPACNDNYTVEPDAFSDGGIHYWPQSMAAGDEE